MAVAFSALLALLGLLWLRTALYRKNWGHGGSLKAIVNGGLGLLAMVPLWRLLPDAHTGMIGGAVLVLLPYRQVMLAHLERLSRKGAAALARDWGVRVEKDSEKGLWTVRRAASGDVTEAWIGNVLTHVRSLHPSVRTSQTYRMWATVVRLPAAPRFTCTIMRGWSVPKYHTSEWRENTTMQGELMGLSMGNVLAEGGRDTGASTEALEVHGPTTHKALAELYTVATSDPEAFDAVFSGELVEQFAATALKTLQYELNVTPTSVSIYTTLAGPDVQKANLAFLERLAAAVTGADSDSTGP